MPRRLKAPAALQDRSLNAFFTAAPAALGVLDRELRVIKAKGGYGLVQDRSTSVVFGMPGEAISLGAAACVLSTDRMAPTLVDLVNMRRDGKNSPCIHA